MLFSVCLAFSKIYFLYVYIYVSTNALKFSVIRESHYSFQISKAIETDKFRKDLLSLRLVLWKVCF